MRASATRSLLAGLARAAVLALLGLSALLPTGCAVSIWPPALPTRAYTPVPLPTPTNTPWAVPARAYYQEGLTRQNLGDLDGAITSFSAALRLRPGMGTAYVSRGGVYLALGEHRQALADAEAALALDPSDASAVMLRAETLRLMGSARSALAAFDEALALDPSLRVASYRSRWLAAEAAGDPERQMALSREYARQQPDDGMRFFYSGWALIEAGRPLSATAVLIEGTGRPTTVLALLWYALGCAHSASSAWPEAVIAFETARALAEAGDSSIGLHSVQPLADLYGMLGRAYLSAGRCLDAQSALERAAALDRAGSGYGAFAVQARQCQTPTPLPTPYPTTTPSRIW